MSIFVFFWTLQWNQQFKCGQKLHFGSTAYAVFSLESAIILGTIRIAIQICNSNITKFNSFSWLSQTKISISIYTIFQLKIPFPIQTFKIPNHGLIIHCCTLGFDASCRLSLKISAILFLISPLWVTTWSQHFCLHLSVCPPLLHQIKVHLLHLNILPSSLH